MTVSDSLRSSNVPEGCWFQLCCWWQGSQNPVPQIGESQCLLHLGWVFCRKREGHRWSRLENWELTILLATLGHQNLGQNTSHSQPLEMNICGVTSFIFVLLIGWALPCLQMYWHHLLQAKEHSCFPLFTIYRTLFSTKLLIKTNCRNKHIKICPAVV